MFNKVARFLVLKTNITTVIDTMWNFGDCRVARLKDDSIYLVTICFKPNMESLFLEKMMELSRNGIIIRKPTIKTDIFGVEL